MAGKTILELVSATGAADADLFLLRKDAETADKSITGALLAEYIQNAAVIDNTGFEVLSGTDVQTLFEQTDVALLNARSTGVRYGGDLSDQGSGVVRISAGEGGILDNSTPSAPDYTAITWAQTDLDLSGADGIYFVYVNSAGVVTSTTTMPSHSEYRTDIYLHRVSIRSGIVSGVTSIVQPLQQYGAQIWDIWQALGSIKRGLGLSAASTNLTIAIASGEVYEPGSNFYTDPTNPHEVTFAAKSPATFRHVDQDGDQTADRTAIDVGNYDLSGTITAIPGASSRAQIFTVKMFPGSGGNVRIFYGQEYFNTVDEAQAALQQGLHNPILPAIYDEAITLGWIITQKGATNLADGVQKFVTANRFGLAGGAISSSGANALLASNNLSDLDDIPTAVATLGLTIGTNTQAWDADLDAIASLANTDGNFIVGNGTTWVAESGNTARTSLGLGTADSPQFAAVNVGNATDTTITRVSAGVIAVEGSNVLLASNIGSAVQAFDAGLQSIADLATVADRMIYTTASDTYATTTLTVFARTLLDDADAATARTTLGLGTLATLNTINNGNWSGTDLSVANGGTGVSTLTGLVKGNGTSAFTAAVQGTDYYAPGGTDVSVADGGTGRSSHTAYAVLCGGTTTTGAQQSVASVGAAGQVLISGGAGALPAFGTAMPSNVKYQIKTDTASIASSTFSDTGLSVTITVGAASSVKISAMLNGIGGTAATAGLLFRVVRDTTPIAVADAAGSRVQATAVGLSDTAIGSASIPNIGLNVVDVTPGAGTYTYKIQWATGSGTGYLNRTTNDTNNTSYFRSVSSLEAMEVLLS